jgi:hypothetical protein
MDIELHQYCADGTELAEREMPVELQRNKESDSAADGGAAVAELRQCTT